MGFHPDSGASFYLSRLPGYLGEINLMQFYLFLILSKNICHLWLKVFIVFYYLFFFFVL